MSGNQSCLNNCTLKRVCCILCLYVFVSCGLLAWMLELSFEIPGLEDEVDRFVEQNIILEDEIILLEQSLQKFTNQNEELAKKKSTMDQNLEDLKILTNDLSQSVTSLKGDIGDLEGNLTKFQTENSQLKGDITELEKKEDEKENLTISLHDKVFDLNTHIYDLNNETETINATLKIAKEDNVKLNETVSNLTKIGKSLNETKNSLQQHLSVTKNENKLLNESISNLREIISFLGEQSGKNQSGMISTISNYLDEETHKEDKILTNRLNDTYKGFSQVSINNLRYYFYFGYWDADLFKPLGDDFAKVWEYTTNDFIKGLCGNETEFELFLTTNTTYANTTYASTVPPVNITLAQFISGVQGYGDKLHEDYFERNVQDISLKWIESNYSCLNFGK